MSVPADIGYRRRGAHAALARSFTVVELVVAIAVILVLFALTVTATVAIMEKSEVRETENIIRLLDAAYGEWKLDADRNLSWGIRDYPPDAVYDMDNGTPHVYTISEVLRRVRRSPKAKLVLAQIDPTFTFVYEDVPADERPGWLRIVSSDDPDPNAMMANNTTIYNEFVGEMVVLDAWGKPIRAVHPGRLPREEQPPFGVEDVPADMEIDEDGTVHLSDQEGGEGIPFYEAEMLYGVARNRQLLFVSAGPDGKFGDVEADENGSEAERKLHEAIHDNVYSYRIEDDHEDE